MKYNNSLQDNSVISTITNQWQDFLGIRSEGVLEKDIFLVRGRCSNKNIYLEYIF